MRKGALKNIALTVHNEGNRSTSKKGELINEFMGRDGRTKKNKVLREPKSTFFKSF